MTVEEIVEEEVTSADAFSLEAYVLYAPEVPRWVDVAITAATTVCERSLAARAKIDGRAARDEEGIERSRYHGRAQPFVLEAHGRPGPSAIAFVRAFSVDGDATASESAADAWAALSSVLQAGIARIELSAYGKNALSQGKAEILRMALQSEFR